MSILVVAILSIVQGATELLPVSSSAHVILLEKLFGLDPTSPEMTFLLVMLHTGTTVAVLIYFWNRWKSLLSRQDHERGTFVLMLVIGTAITAVVGLVLQALLVRAFLPGQKGAVVENLFGNVWIIATALASVGVLTTIAGFLGRRDTGSKADHPATGRTGKMLWTGLLAGTAQGLALPFRGFSRSGGTISTGLLGGLERRFAEELSFALGLILTIPVVAREALRLRATVHAAGQHLSALPWLWGLAGAVLSFGAGLAAIRWLSSWLERGRWGFFGLYCLALSAVIFVLASTRVLG